MGRMDVYLVTPERELWSGEASIVIARGSEGELGIMAGHAPLLIQLDGLGNARGMNDLVALLA